jgi:DNA modification methylase
VIAWRKPDDLVDGPTCGIGTSIVEAIHLGRLAIGSKLEPPEYHPPPAISCMHENDRPRRNDIEAVQCGDSARRSVAAEVRRRPAPLGADGQA